MITTETCNTCAACNIENNTCMLTRRNIVPNTSHCEAHRRTPFEHCEKCGKTLWNPFTPFILMDAAGNAHLFCNVCIAGAKV